MAVARERQQYDYLTAKAIGCKGTAMVDRVINILAAVTLIEMMITVGLGVSFSDVLGVAKSWRLVARALVGNYILVPSAAVGLLLLFHANAMVAAGFLIVAVCPGAPYGPPFTALAKGNVTLAVGLMFILAGSSAVIAPLLLGFLLPIMAGNTPLKVNVLKMVVSLLGAQLLPLCLGLWVRHRYPEVAARLKKPGGRLSTALNVLLLGVILSVQFRMLAGIRARGYLGMLCLLLATIAIGGLMGGKTAETSKSMMLTTAVRNVGVGLVIATSSFPGTPAISATTAYAVFQTILIALFAVSLGRLTPAQIALVEKRAA
jgi:BASS family bile acid:Na+ symporter